MTCLCNRIFNCNSSVLFRRFKRSFTTQPKLLDTTGAMDVDLKADARRIFQSGLNAVLPNVMIQQSLKREKDLLTLDNCQYDLKNNVHLIASGKAVLGMIRAVENMLGDHVVGGIASVPVGLADTLAQNGYSDLLPNSTSRVKVYEGAANNQPDAAAHSTALAVRDYVTSLGADDLVFALISGGGSALLPLPREPITPLELVNLSRLLQRRGATIQQLNTVRKHLEELKGGGLARAAQPAKVVSLIISDVIGDSLELIASGPTAADYSTPQQCSDLFELFGIEKEVPESIKTLLKNELRSFKRPHITSVTSGQFQRSLTGPQPVKSCDNAHNVIIGSNASALVACQKEAQNLGYLSYVMTSSQAGEARDVGGTLARLGVFLSDVISRGHSDAPSPRAAQLELDLIRRGLLKSSLNDLVRLAHKSVNTGRPLGVLLGGETTVTVTGDGKGGRNTEMALAAALELQTHEDLACDVFLLSAGTDGQDGPTDAAGAEATNTLAAEAVSQGLQPVHYLQNNDSYTFYESLKNSAHLYKTGLTGTNVMDIQILLINTKKDTF